MPRALLVLGLVALSTVAISAEPSPKDAWQYRHGLFESLGVHMKRAGLLAQEGAPHSEDLVLTAEILHATAKLVPHGFPEGSGPDQVKETRALPAIWSDRAGFDAAAQRLVDETGKLLELAKAGDRAGFGAQMKQVGAACGSCHESYRASKK